MKRLIVILSCLTLLSACGSMKKTVIDDTSTETTKTDIKATKATVVREKADTNVTVKGSSQSGTKPVNELLKGDSLVLDNNDQRVTVKYDAESGSLQATAQTKPRIIPVQIDRTTEISETTDIATTTEAKVEIKHTEKQRDNSGFSMGIIVSLFGILLVIFGALFVYSRITK